MYLAFSILLMACLLFNICFFQGIYQADTYSMILCEFAMAVISLLAVVKLFLEDDSAIMLNTHPYFWISAGTLIFSAGALIIMGLHQYILVKNLRYYGLRVDRYVMPTLNYILYSSYGYAFILCRKLTNKPSQQ